jgi:UDP-N-acetylglucosamine 4-epimerase
LVDLVSLKNKSVLVTGGAGFIGSHIVDALLEQNARVRVLDNFETGRRENLNHVINRIDLIEGDIRDLHTCKQALLGVDLVCHQAALGSVPRSLAEPATSILTNVAGTANVFQAARDAGVKRVVYASSSSVYGDSAILPKREGTEGRVLSPYALSKAIDEQLADIFTRCFEMELVGLRYFNVYGPRQNPNGPYAAVIPKYFDACASGKAPVIYGDGEQSRDFTFVRDIARVNLTILAAESAKTAAYNVGAGGRTSVKFLAETIARLSGFCGEIEYTKPRPGDVLHSLADTSKLQNDFGCAPTTTLADGLKVSAQYYLSKG